MPQKKKAPWKGQASSSGPSSLLSDRISPRPAPSSQQPGAGIAKKDRQSSPASAVGNTNNPSGKQVKSPQVLKLENLVKELRKSDGTARDPTGGCFCLARDHPLSDYVRMCQSCGLILCSVNLPLFACPFCSEPLLSSEERKLLIADLEQQIMDTLAREAEERERAVLEAKRAAGAFPTLLDTMNQQQQSRHAPTHSQQQKNTNQDPRMNLPPLAQDSHKVMSLRTGSNKVVMSSGSRTASSARGLDASRAQEKEKEKEKEVKRVPRPANQPKHSTRKVDPSRPWENLLL